jgi:PKD repeat protein
MVTDLVIDGNAVNVDLGFENPVQTALTNMVFNGTDIADGFQITGNVRFAWTGNIPQNSSLNFNFKIGNIDCVPTNINQPGLLSYVWDFGDGTTSTLMNPIKTYNSAGVYDVSLTANGNGTSDTETVHIEVVASVAPVINQMNVSNGGGNVVKEFTLTNASSFDSFSWTDAQGNSGLFSNQAAVTFSFSQAGYFEITISAIDSNGCSIDAVIPVVVSSEEVNGGNDGGIESESLGDAVSKVYVQRKKNSIPTVFEKTDDLIFEKPLALRTNEQQLMDLFPTNLVEGSVAHVTSPTDILDYTIAQEVLSVDFSLAGKNKAVVLGVKTVGRVYNHTKASCDRLRGAEILNVEKVNVGDRTFLIQALKQRNNVTEYAVSFALGKNETEEHYSIQTNWLASNYFSSDEVFNFQVWSVDPIYTIKLVQDILNNLALPVEQIHPTVLPQTYVSKVSRDKFDLVLRLHC